MSGSGRLRARIGALCVMLAVVAACSDDGNEGPDLRAEATTTSGPSTTALADAPSPSPAGESIEIDAEPPRRMPAGPVTWTISFTNVTEGPVTVTFPSAQSGDAVVLDDDGTVVHRWSDGRFFDQAVRDLTLAPGQTELIELADDLTGVEPGFYELRLELSVVAPPEPFEQNLRITAAD